MGGNARRRDRGGVNGRFCHIAGPGEINRTANANGEGRVHVWHPSQRAYRSGSIYNSFVGAETKNAVRVNTRCGSIKGNRYVSPSGYNRCENLEKRSCAVLIKTPANPGRPVAKGSPVILSKIPSGTRAVQLGRRSKVG